MSAFDDISAPCEACGFETWPSEWYALAEEVFPGDQQRVLCLGCVEIELGRRLTPADFPPRPINDSQMTDSQRLRSRKGPSRFSEAQLKSAVLWVESGWSVADAAEEWRVEPGMLATWVENQRITDEMLEGFNQPKEPDDYCN